MYLFFTIMTISLNRKSYKYYRKTYECMSVSAPVPISAKYTKPPDVSNFGKDTKRLMWNFKKNDTDEKIFPGTTTYPYFDLDSNTIGLSNDSYLFNNRFFFFFDLYTWYWQRKIMKTALKWKDGFQGFRNNQIDEILK